LWLLHHRLLTKNDGAYRGLGGCHLSRDRLGLAHDGIFELLEALSGRCHHIRSCESIH
jgi:hypothetical protein